MLAATLAAAHKPGHRLPDLTPFELEQGERAGGGPAQPRLPQGASAFGCVEWFQYLDRPAAAATASPRGQRRPRPDTPL
jgi:hypothetical protein